MKNQKSKKAFGMVFAVLLMMTIASIGMHTLYLINQNTNIVTREYIDTQLQLYLGSTIEYTLLVLSEKKDNSDVDSATKKYINITYPGDYVFTVNITPLSIPNTMQYSRGTVLLDIIGTYNKLNGIPIRIFERTIQKP